MFELFRRDLLSGTAATSAAEKMMVQGFHYPFPAHACIEKTADGYRETMVPWNAAI